MCSRRDHYIEMFSNLRTHQNRTFWPAVTLHRAPYKPFLLLAVMTQFNNGTIHRNFIEPSSDLERKYTEFCKLIPRIKTPVNLALPFISLRGSGFWTLAPRNTKAHDGLYHSRSVHQMRHAFFGARFDTDLFPLLRMDSHRNKFTDSLVHNYFAPAVQNEIRQLTEGAPRQ